jgi:hypothetical protein
MAKTAIEKKHPALVAARRRKEEEASTISVIDGWEVLTDAEKECIIAYRNAETKRIAAKQCGKNDEWLYRRIRLNKQFRDALSLVKTGKLDEALTKHQAKDLLPDVMQALRDNLEPGTPINHKMATITTLLKLSGVDKPPDAPVIQNNFINSNAIPMPDWSPSARKYTVQPKPVTPVAEEITEGEFRELDSAC